MKTRLLQILEATEQINAVQGLVDGLVESQKPIVQLIIDNPYISMKDMAEHVGISTTAMDKNLLMLKKKKHCQKGW